MSTTMRKGGGAGDRTRAQAGRRWDWPVARWIDRPSETGSIEDRAAALFRQASNPGPLGPEAHDRVHRRLNTELSRRTIERKRRNRAVFLHWGVAAGVLLGSGVVIAARGVNRWWHPGASSQTQALSPPRLPETTKARRVHRPTARPVANAAGDSPPLGTTDDLTASSAPEHVEPERAVLTAHPAPSPKLETKLDKLDKLETKAETETDLSAEVRLLNGAITGLRQQGDAAGALVNLEAYERRFPHGTLAIEANTARVEALLLLGDRPAALARLERLPLGDGAHGQELRTIRGELRASASNCAGAIIDFGTVLAAPSVGSSATVLRERALYGRAVCHLRNGSLAPALGDARFYLEQFPEGKFATDARLLLARARELQNGSAEGSTLR